MHTSRQRPRSRQSITARRGLVVSTSALAAALVGIAPPSFAGAPLPQHKAGAPIAGLTSAQLDRFIAGRVDYIHTLTDSEGLGPIFNKASCGNCHNNPVGGTGSQTVTRFGLADKSGFDPLTALGGSLLQALAISEECIEIVPSEANITSLRITNGAMGYGLIEAIPDADLLANRDAQPLPQRGVAHMVPAFEDPPLSPLRVGRFGWKAQVATILTFSADAGQNELGLSNRFIPFDNAPNGDRVRLAQCDAVADPEDHPDGNGRHFIDRVTDFQRFLTQPPQTPRSGMSGEAIFNAIGCAVCHTPSFTTSTNPLLEEALRGKTIRPYSDFLLHDVGINADFIVQGAGTEQLLKTPPLWGVRRRDPMWHDGRIAAGTFASRIDGAILEHGGLGSQGIAAAAAYVGLTQPEKDDLVTFLDSLGRIEFDADADDDVQLDDFVAFADCYVGGPYTADDACAVSDIDQNGDVDLADFGSFLFAYEGVRRDCNGNGIIDLRDIIDGAPDTDNNGVLDSCQPTCDADVNGTGTVNIDDLLTVISGWGTCPIVPAPCAADVNADDVVNIDDLLFVISAWGNC